MNAHNSIINKISNNLYQGNYSDFRSAVSDLRVAYEHEKKINPYEAGTNQHENDQQFWENQIKQCDKARTIYDACVREAEQKAIEQMREQGLEMFAEALELEDYSHLAF
ncbi:hypothetical protein ACQ4M3_08070 [Leptolyngbya sp. AN03gr2]|uniref:hypothetical protein n=1 Tax=unclassified Leptolyngbya TaxID=2650499 RepID=UPI003D31EE88